VSFSSLKLFCAEKSSFGQFSNIPAKQDLIVVAYKNKLQTIHFICLEERHCSSNKGIEDRIITCLRIKNNVSLGTIWVDISMLLASFWRDMRKT
jgi:hypothetical protein